MKCLPDCQYLEGGEFRVQETGVWQTSANYRQVGERPQMDSCLQKDDSHLYEAASHLWACIPHCFQRSPQLRRLPTQKC